MTCCSATPQQGMAFSHLQQQHPPRPTLSPRRSASKELVEVTHPYTKYTCASIQPSEWEECSKLFFHSNLEGNFGNVTLHPLLVNHRAEPFDPGVKFALEFSVLKDI
jgi:hypothetical protein